MKQTYSIGFTVWLLLAAAIASLYFFGALHLPRSSDNAIALIMANDMLSGNFLLKYWITASANFYTLDLPVYAFCIKILGYKPHLMYSLPALFYGLLASITSMIAFNLNQLKQQKYFSLLICLFLIAIPAEIILTFRFSFHLLTILYVLIVFWLFSHTHKQRAWFLAFVLLLLSNVGDPISYFIGNIPLLVIAFMPFAPKDKRWRGAILSLSSLCLSLGIKKIIVHYGFVISPLNTSFVSFEDFGRNIAYTFRGILAVFNANIFGQPLFSLFTFLEVCHLFILLAGTLLLIRFFKKMGHAYQYDYARNGFLSLLAVAGTLNILFALFAAQFTGLYCERYLMPAFIFLSIFFAAEIPHLIKKYKMGILFLIFLLVLSGIDFYHQTKQHVNEDYAKRVVVEKYLLTHHLTQGFGAYWSGHIFTVETYQALKIRPVIANEKNRLAPFHYLSKSTWYDPQNKANFLIFDDTNWGNVNLSSAIKTFGQPAQTVSLGPYTILIWNKNITPELS